MKPQKFKIGQPVTPVNNEGYVCENISIYPLPPSPVFGKIYHVDGYLHYNGKAYCFLRELPSNVAVEESRLAPVISDSVLESELATIGQEITV